MVMEKGEGDLKTYFAQNSSEQPAIQLELIKKCWQDMLQAVLVVHDNGCMGGWLDEWLRRWLHGRLVG